MKRVLWVLAVLSLIVGVLPARGSGRTSNDSWQAFASLAPDARQAVAAEALRQAIGEDVRVSMHAATGAVRFVGASAGTLVSGRSAGRSPDATLDLDAALDLDVALDLDATLDLDAIESAARSFLATYGPLFGLQQPHEELATLARKVLDDRRGVIRFQQQHGSLPVFGGEMVLQLRAGRLLAAVAEISPDLAVDLVPTVAPEDAGQRAVEMVAKFQSLAPEALTATEPGLWLYDPRLVGAPGPQEPRLVWRLNVRAAERLEVNELVLVDAHTGTIALHFSEAPTTLTRVIYDNNNDPSIGLPGSAPVRTENTNLAPGVLDVDLAFQYAQDTYRFFEALGRDSIDGLGMPLISTVRYCPPGAQCPYPNAFWNGEQMAYGAGMVIDDVVAHEMTHGVTEHESRLFYYMQSGAINEGFSDAFGEFVDLTNGRGRDLPEDRWLIGEELPTGIGLPVPLRNLRNPETRSHPDRMTSTYYRCGTDDYGGVHTNGTVLGKAVYLMTDGDTFNGQTVTGLGIDKVSRILYEAQTNLLTSGSDYADLFDALVQAATHLVGRHGITSADVEQVRRAALATEMHLQPTRCAAVEAPVCGVGSQQVVWADDLERPAGNGWVTGVLHGAVSRWYFPQTDNPYPGWDMTNATSGRYNLWGDADFGGFWYGYGASFGASDSYIAMRRAVTVPAGAYLRFDHAHSFEETVGYYYDGGLIEYTTDGGLTWLDAGPLITHNGYAGALFGGSGNPLGGRQAFGGDSNGYTSTRLDLEPLAGESVRFRFRIVTDDSGGGYGWFIDDVVMYTCSPTASTTPTSPTPTPTTPTPTRPTPTATPRATPAPGETLPPGRMLTLPLVTRGYTFVGRRTILADGFEDAFPGAWLAIDNNPADGREYVWAKSACRPGADASSAWAVGGGTHGSALGCGAEYPGQIDSWLVYGPFSLEDATSAGLDLRLWLNTVRDQDYVALMASVDGIYYYGSSMSGNTGGWVDHTLDLTAVHSLGNLAGRPQVWVAVTFESDGADAAGEGAYIDEVHLWKARGPAIAALAPSAAPESTGTTPIARALTP